ncbi:MAG: hypothetical protein ACREEG_17940, partial [Phenylobacterium sp.]
KLDDAINALSAATVLQRCANTNDNLSCATISRTASGAISGIANPLINIGGIRTEALDINVNWTSPDWSFGRFGAHWYSTRLLKFTELLPTSTGLAPTKRLGTERGSPDQAYPKWKSNFLLDWDHADFGATGTVRYLSSVQEADDPNKLNSRTYFDAQFRWTPNDYVKGVKVAVGVNNLFDKDPPGCVTCSLNNYDPNAYDAPGRFFYLQLTYRQ